MKSFIAEDSFWELFPQAAIGVVVVKGMKPAAQIPQEDVDAIAALLDRANIDAERHLTSDTISENAPVKAWREAYRLFKTKKGARCSVENLLKRVLKGKPVGHITPAVDIYNTISLTYALPVGGEDLHAVEGNLRLAVTNGGDAFLPLGEEADDPTLPGELAISMMRAPCAVAGTGAMAFARRCPTIRLTHFWRLNAWSPSGWGTARPRSIAWPSCSSAIWERRSSLRRL
mgnify:CR=1 FL=1